MPFSAIWIDLEMIKISEVSRTERLISYDVTYVWNLKKKKQTKTYFPNRDSDTKNKLMVKEGERWGGMMNEEVGINIYILLYIKEGTNKNLLYSTENYTQCFVNNL